jgi:hypothetical protein
MSFSRIFIFFLVFCCSFQAVLAQQQTVRELQPIAQHDGTIHFPAWIRYTGTLTDQTKQSVNLTFAIYKDHQGGQPIWQESQNVELDASGHYSAILGVASPDGVPQSIFVSSEAQWLGVRVNDEPELPRALLLSVPYAMKAQSADTLAGAPASDFVLRSELPQLFQALPHQSPASSPSLSQSTNFVAQATTVSNPTTVMQSSSAADVLLVEQDGAGYALHAIGASNGALFAETSSQSISNFTILSLNHAPGGTAVRAEAQADTGHGIGVWGGAYGETGTGVLGENPALAGTTYGVRGKTFSDSGIGIFGANLSQTGSTTGVRGETRSPDGTAGVFDSYNGGNILSGRNSGAEKFKVDTAGNTFASGTVSASSFVGDGSKLTNVNADLLNGLSAASVFNDEANFQKLNSTQLQINSDPALAGQFGYAGIVRDDLDVVHSYINQAGSQLHFRLSRVTPDDNGAKDFLIVPYQYGVALEYPGVIEAWSRDFSIHTNPYGQGGARFWVGDDLDLGGLFVTSHVRDLADTGNVTLAADRFTHASHGSMNFVTRNINDTFRFNNGPYNLESMFGQIFKTQATSNVEAYSGSLTASLVANSGMSAVQFGSRSGSRVDIITDDSTPQVSVFPSGNVSIGSTADTAKLAVGSSGQFQVSSNGTVTIGGGTPIIQHVSTIAAVSFVSLAPTTCQVMTIAAAGASDADSVALGIPNVLAAAGDLVLFGWVSAQDTVSIRACNMGSTTLDNPAGNVRVDVWKH